MSVWHGLSFWHASTTLTRIDTTTRIGIRARSPHDYIAVHMTTMIGRDKTKENKDTNAGPMAVAIEPTAVWSLIQRLIAFNTFILSSQVLFQRHAWDNSNSGSQEVSLLVAFPCWYNHDCTIWAHDRKPRRVSLLWEKQEEKKKKTMKILQAFLRSL